MPRALSEGVKEPSLHDEHWRAFIQEREANSALARHQWSRYRQGLKRLEKRYTEHVPAEALRRSLAEDAFHCAVHWRQSPQVVRHALRELLTHPLGVERYTFAAAEYQAWAAQSSQEDLPGAEQMLAQAREAMQSLPPLARRNLEQMLRHRVRP